jgi:hypothetical protein
MLRKFTTFLTISAICTLDLVSLTTEPILAQPDPATCIQGYVWREATPNDLVCVTPETRTQTAEDNSVAASRIDPVDRTYGPLTCVQGYVWRVTTPNDLVCVTPEVRSQAAADNSQASSRRINISKTTTVPEILEPYQFLGTSNQSYVMARLNALNNARKYLITKFSQYEYENQNLELNDIEINKDEGISVDNQWVSWVVIQLEVKIVDCPNSRLINCRSILPVSCYFKDPRNCSRRK